MTMRYALCLLATLAPMAAADAARSDDRRICTDNSRACLENTARLYLDALMSADDSQVPLAADVLTKGGFALNPRGEFYTKDNIAQQLTMRAFMEELRSGGVDTGGPAAFSQSDRQQFANSLDRHLSKHHRKHA